MELIEQYYFNLSEVSYITKAINEYLKGIEKTRFFSKERRDYKKKINELRKELEDTSLKVKSNYNELTKLSTYDSELILPLLKNHISDVEKEEYFVVNIKEDDYDDYYYPSGNALDTPMLMRRYGSSYNIITTGKNKDILENSESQKYLNSYLELLDDEKYIFLDDTKTQTLLHGLELSEQFNEYPYLKDFSYKLLEMRLENPNISNEEIKEQVSNNKIKKR